MSLHHEDPMRARATDSGVDDGWRGARIGAQARDLARREATRIEAEIDIGEPGRPRVVLAFLAVALIATLIEFSTFGASPTASELSRAGGAGIGAIASGAWWKLITSNLLHGGILHLGLNVFVIFLTGRWLEHLVGPLIVLATIAWSMVLASVGALLVDAPTVSIGASGVAFGLVGCAVAVDPRARTATGVIARQLAVVNVVFTFVLPGISIGGHLGGLLAGLLVGAACWDRRADGDGASDGAGAGRARRAAAPVLLAASLVPLAIMAIGPSALPGEAHRSRAQLTAWLLQRQLSGAELSNSLRIDDASCESTNDLLRYRCTVNSGDEAIVVFDERDDQWTLSLRGGSKR